MSGVGVVVSVRRHHATSVRVTGASSFASESVNGIFVRERVRVCVCEIERM